MGSSSIISIFWSCKILILSNLLIMEISPRIVNEVEVIHIKGESGNMAFAELIRCLCPL